MRRPTKKRKINEGLQQNARFLEGTNDFGVRGNLKVRLVRSSPSELEPAPGTRRAGHRPFDDIARSMSAVSVHGAVSKDRMLSASSCRMRTETVCYANCSSEAYSGRQYDGSGKDIGGNLLCRLARMPHLLIAHNRLR